MSRYWIEGAVALLLLGNAALDGKRQEISLGSLALFAAAGLAVNLQTGYRGIEEMLCGAAPGLLLLLVSLLTKGAVGFGDGLLLCVTGIFLGGTENTRLLFRGLLLCSIVLGAGLGLGRTSWKQRFPFVPFLLLAQLWRMFEA